MAPTERVQRQARETLFLLKKACQRFWKKNGKSKSCTVEQVTGTQFDFKNPYGLSIQASGPRKDFKASITQIEENFQGEKEKITYSLDSRRGGVTQKPRKSILHFKAGGCEETLDRELKQAHDAQIASGSCGTEKMSVAVADWECFPSGSVVGICEKRAMSCSRPYSCRKATPEEADRLFTQAHEMQVMAALNRLHLACREFFKSEGKEGDCRKELQKTMVRGLGNVELKFQGKKQKFTATATGRWKGKDGKDVQRSFQMNHKGEMTPLK